VDLVLVSLFGELEERAKFPFVLGPKNSLGGPVAKHYKDPGKRVILIWDEVPTMVEIAIF
jgi:hypothetical protein